MGAVGDFDPQPLTSAQHTAIAMARLVAVTPHHNFSAPHDDLLRGFAERVTLAPWTVDDTVLEPLRAAGYDDAAIFDITATITSAGVFSRIEVALTALGT